MSEAAETPEVPTPMIASAMVGAASPLWGYFAGAAMSGVAFWWAAKFVQPASYEALFARLPAPEPRSFAAVEEAVEEAVEAPFVAAEAAVESSPLAVVEAVAEEAAANDLAAKTA